MTGEKNDIGVMTHELTSNEIIGCRKSVSVEIAKWQNYKKTVLSQLNAHVRCLVVTRRVFESTKCDKIIRLAARFGSFSAPPDLLAAIGEGKEGKEERRGGEKE